MQGGESESEGPIPSSVRYPKSQNTPFSCRYSGAGATAGPCNLAHIPERNGRPCRGSVSDLTPIRSAQHFPKRLNQPDTGGILNSVSITRLATRSTAKVRSLPVRKAQGGKPGPAAALPKAVGAEGEWAEF